MEKNILRDVMTSERSIRHVPLPRGRRAGASEDIDEESVIYEHEEVAVDSGSPRRWSRILLWSVVVLFVLAFFAILAGSFSGARVMVTPKVAFVSVNEEFEATRGSGGKLTFEILPLTRTAEITVSADETRRVSDKASGTVIIYNNFSESSQRLIKNTRFESPSGRIYRIDRSIVVPGKAVQGGKVIPGSIDATVFADSAGAEYNSPLTDFTIPGFKTDPARYATFYARSKTPMSGGYEGMLKTPSKAAVETAVSALEKELETDMRELARGSTPDGFISFPGAFSIVFEKLPIETRGGDKAAVRVKATAGAYVFRRGGLTDAIAKKTTELWNGLPVEVPELDSLSFALLDKQSGDPTAVSALRFSLRGDARIVWLFEEEKLRAALLGKEREDLAAALGSFPTIEKIDVVIQPFWRRSFPSNPKSLDVERVLPSRPTAPQTVEAP